jgi:hypothetical protein
MNTAYLLFPKNKTIGKGVKYIVAVGTEQSNSDVKERMGAGILVLRPGELMVRVSASGGSADLDNGEMPARKDSPEINPGGDLYFYGVSTYRFGQEQEHFSLDDRALDNVLDALGNPIPDASYMVHITCERDAFMIGPISPEKPFRARQPVVCAGKGIDAVPLIYHPDYGIGEGGFGMWTSSASTDNGAPRNMDLRLALVHRKSKAYERAARGRLVDPDGNPVPYARMEVLEDLNARRHLRGEIPTHMAVWSDGDGCFTFYPPRWTYPGSSIPEFLPYKTWFFLWLNMPNRLDLNPYVAVNNAEDGDLVLKRGPKKRIRVLDENGKAIPPRSVSLELHIPGLMTVFLAERYMTEGGTLGMEGGVISCCLISGSGEHNFEPPPVKITPDTPEEIVFRLKPRKAQPRDQPQKAQQPRLSPGDSRYVLGEIETEGVVVDYASGKPVAGAMVLFYFDGSGNTAPAWKPIRKKWLAENCPRGEEAESALMREGRMGFYQHPSAMIFTDEQGRFHLKSKATMMGDKPHMQYGIAVLQGGYLPSVYSLNNLFFSKEGYRYNKLYIAPEISARVEMEVNDPRFRKLSCEMILSETPITQDDSGYPRANPGGGVGMRPKFPALCEALSRSGMLRQTIGLAGTGKREIRIPFPAGVYGALSLRIDNEKNRDTLSLGRRLIVQATPANAVCDLGSVTFPTPEYLEACVQLLGPSGKPLPGIPLLIKTIETENKCFHAGIHETYTDAAGTGRFQIPVIGTTRVTGIVHDGQKPYYAVEQSVRQFELELKPSSTMEQRTLKVTLADTELQALAPLLPVEEYR